MSPISPLVFRIFSERLDHVTNKMALFYSLLALRYKAGPFPIIPLKARLSKSINAQLMVQEQAWPLPSLQESNL